MLHKHVSSSNKKNSDLYKLCEKFHECLSGIGELKCNDIRFVEISNNLSELEEKVTGSDKTAFQKPIKNPLFFYFIIFKLLHLIKTDFMTLIKDKKTEILFDEAKSLESTTKKDEDQVFPILNNFISILKELETEPENLSTFPVNIHELRPNHIQMMTTILDFLIMSPNNTLLVFINKQLSSPGEKERAVGFPFLLILPYLDPTDILNSITPQGKSEPHSQEETYFLPQCPEIDPKELELKILCLHELLKSEIDPNTDLALHALREHVDKFNKVPLQVLFIRELIRLKVFLNDSKSSTSTNMQILEYLKELSPDNLLFTLFLNKEESKLNTRSSSARPSTHMIESAVTSLCLIVCLLNCILETPGKKDQHFILSKIIPPLITSCLGYALFSFFGMLRREAVSLDLNIVFNSDRPEAVPILHEALEETPMDIVSRTPNILYRSLAELTCIYVASNNPFAIVGGLVGSLNQITKRNPTLVIRCGFPIVVLNYLDTPQKFIESMQTYKDRGLFGRFIFDLFTINTFDINIFTQGENISEATTGCERIREKLGEITSVWPGVTAPKNSIWRAVVTAWAHDTCKNVPEFAKSIGRLDNITIEDMQIALGEMQGITPSEAAQVIQQTKNISGAIIRRNIEAFEERSTSISEKLPSDFPHTMTLGIPLILRLATHKAKLRIPPWKKPSPLELINTVLEWLKQHNQESDPDQAGSTKIDPSKSRLITEIHIMLSRCFDHLKDKEKEFTPIARNLQDLLKGKESQLDQTILNNVLEKYKKVLSEEKRTPFEKSVLALGITIETMLESFPNHKSFLEQLYFKFISKLGLLRQLTVASMETSAAFSSYYALIPIHIQKEMMTQFYGKLQSLFDSKNITLTLDEVSSLKQKGDLEKEWFSKLETMCKNISEEQNFKNQYRLLIEFLEDIDEHKKDKDNTFYVKDMYTVIAKLLDANLKEDLSWIWNIVAERFRTSPVVPYLLNMQYKFPGACFRYANIDELNTALVVKGNEHIQVTTCPKSFDPLRYKRVNNGPEAANASFTGLRSNRTSPPRACPGLPLAGSEEATLLKSRWLARILWLPVPLDPDQKEPINMKHPESVLPGSLGNTPNITIEIIQYTECNRRPLTETPLKTN